MVGEKAPPPVPPHEVALRLRPLLQNIKLKLGHVGVPAKIPNSCTADMEAARIERDKAINAYYRALSAADTRRTAAMRAAVLEMQTHVIHERNYRTSAYSTLRDAFPVSSGSPGSQASLASMVQEAYDLVQSLPTSQNLPSGQLENIVRGIMALLRTVGFEGAESLKWEEVIKNAQKNAAKAAAAEAAAAAKAEAAAADKLAVAAA
jgi:hypothetical protein